jgi:hypothetical protein
MAFGEEDEKVKEAQEESNQQQLARKEREIFNAFAARAPNDQAAQVRAALFAIPLPTEKNFQDWFPVLQASIDIVARIPGYDTKVYNELVRDMEDLVDRANSQGRRRIVASKMQKFIFKLRALVPKGDVPLVGMTAISAMITTNVNQKQYQEVRMPMTTPQTQSLFSGVKEYLHRGERK